MGHGDRPFNFAGHPYYIARSSLRHAFSEVIQPNRNHKVLDVGCGLMPYRDLFHKDSVYVGLEIDQPRNKNHPYATHFYDGTKIPFPDGHFDYILCSQVLEHSSNPQACLAEVFRVLRPTGTFTLSIPFLWPEHEQPWDFQRYTSYRLLYELENLGFADIQLKKLNPGLSALLQLTIEWIEGIALSCISRINTLSYRRAANLLWRFLVTPFYSIANIVAATYRKLCRPQPNTRSIAPAMFLDIVVTSRKP